MQVLDLALPGIVPKAEFEAHLESDQRYLLLHRSAFEFSLIFIFSYISIQILSDYHILTSRFLY